MMLSKTIIGNTVHDYANISFILGDEENSKDFLYRTKYYPLQKTFMSIDTKEFNLPSIKYGYWDINIFEICYTDTLSSLDTVMDSINNVKSGNKLHRVMGFTKHSDIRKPVSVLTQNHDNQEVICKLYLDLANSTFYYNLDGALYELHSGLDHAYNLKHEIKESNHRRNTSLDKVHYSETQTGQSDPYVNIQFTFTQGDAHRDDHIYRYYTQLDTFISSVEVNNLTTTIPMEMNSSLFNDNILEKNSNIIFRHNSKIDTTIKKESVYILNNGNRIKVYTDLSDRALYVYINSRLIKLSDYIRDLIAK